MILNTEMLKEKYKDYSSILDKIKREVDCGNLFRITRGLYETNKNVNPILLASSILGPSYISFDYALSYYGLIPERVYAITSAAIMLNKNKTYTNYFGRFEYSNIPEEAYPYGITFIKEDERLAIIATKEKAICDSLYKWPPVNSVKQLKILMFEDKRIDQEEFETCNFKEMLEIASFYNKKNLKFLIKLIKKEYLNE